MAFRRKVERWRQHVIDALARKNYPWPPELVLALMQRESGGNIGATNPQSGASGLLQVMPGTLDHYNQTTGQSIPLSKLRETTESAVPTQINVGLWVLGRYWRRAFEFLSDENQTTDVPIDELVRWGDAMYHAGPAGIRRLSRNLARPLTWAVWSSKYPNSKITIHADAVWSNTQNNNPTWNLDAVSNWVSGGDIDIPVIDDPDPIITQPDPKFGLIIGLLVIALGYYFLKGKK